MFGLGFNKDAAKDRIVQRKERLDQRLTADLWRRPAMPPLSDVNTAPSYTGPIATPPES